MRGIGAGSEGGLKLHRADGEIMRQEAIGFVLAAALIGGLFFAVNHRAGRLPAPGGVRPAADVAAIRAAAAAIKPGFVGLERLGAWEIACSAGPVTVGPETASAPEEASPAKSPALPLSLGENRPIGGSIEPGPDAAPQANPPPAAASPPMEKVSLGRCRATQAFRRKGAGNDEVALAVNFRIIGGGAGRLGMFVRLPAGKGRQGESLQLRLAKGGFNLPIASCGNGACMAVAILAADAERDVSAARGAELLMTPDPAGKRTVVRLAVSGLPEALAAIRRAQL